jgi:hypothetical protein
VQEAKARGADGIKFIGGAEDVLFAAIEEANKLGLHTTMHHAQPSVAFANVLTTSAHGPGVDGALVWPARGDVH